MNIFVSVGSTSNQAQEDFVRAIEDRLRAEGLTPQTLGRNFFTVDSPFIAINNLMDTCVGVVVIALERIHIEQGTEKRGGNASKNLADIKMATSWNQIEATLAYSRKLPLLIIVEQGLRQDGLLELGFEWYVIKTDLDSRSLTTNEFNGVLNDWKQKLSKTPSKRRNPQDASEMTIGQLLSTLKTSQLWSFLAAIITLIAGAFALGAKLVSF